MGGRTGTRWWRHTSLVEASGASACVPSDARSAVLSALPLAALAGLGWASAATADALAFSCEGGILRQSTQGALRGTVAAGGLAVASSSGAAVAPAAAPASPAALLGFAAAAGGAAALAKRRSQVTRKAQATQEKTKEQKEREEEYWWIFDYDCENYLDKEFGRENLGRFYEFVDFCKYKNEVPKLTGGQDVDREYFPGLRAKPWWDPSELGDWIKKVEEGLPYVQEELADLLETDEEALISDSVKNDVMGGGWSGFRLQRLGNLITKNVEKFPKTMQLLKESGAPLAMRGVIVARQQPGTGVAPHSDGRNCFLTAHFGLSIPEGCSMTVGGIKREWVEDGAIVIDTSFTHSTENLSDEDRFVLIVDFWHPDLTYEEIEVLEYFYDFRNKFEQGKIQYKKKMPNNIWDTLMVYSAWGEAYTEENDPRNKGANFIDKSDDLL